MTASIFAPGMPLAFSQDDIDYYTLVPLSTRRISGAAALPTYDPVSLLPGAPDRTFFGSIDLDSWARRFLVAVDELLSPPCAAVLDGPARAALRQAHSRLAQALANSIAPLSPPVPPGKLAAARAQFEQRALASLSSVYIVPAAGPAAPHSSPGPSQALFAALASFMAAWPVLRPYVSRPPAAAALLRQVQAVAQAWEAARPVAEPAPARATAPPGTIAMRSLRSFL